MCCGYNRLYCISSSVTRRNNAVCEQRGDGRWDERRCAATVAEMWRKPRVCGRVAAPGSHVQNNRQTRPLSRDTATSGTTNSPFVVRSHALYQFLWFCDTHHSVTWPTFLPMFDSSHLSILGHCNDLENVSICDGSSSITYFFGRNSRNDRHFSSIFRNDAFTGMTVGTSTIESNKQSQWYQNSSNQKEFYKITLTRLEKPLNNYKILFWVIKTIVHTLGYALVTDWRIQNKFFCIYVPTYIKHNNLPVLLFLVCCYLAFYV